MRHPKTLVAFLLGSVFFAGVAYAAPWYTFQKSILPSDATENLGSTSSPWDEGHFNEICLGGDCETVWPAGGGGGTGNVATSTSETTGQLSYWTSTSATPATLGKVATSSLTIGAPLTTSGTPGALVGGTNLTIDIDDIKAADLDLTDITLGDFTNDAGFITAAVTDIGPVGQTSNGPTVTFATSSDTNIGLTITGSGDTQTFTSNWIGTLANSRLANSSVSYGGVTLSLGGTDATPAFDLTDATSLPIVAGTTGTLTYARGGTGTSTAALLGQVLSWNGSNYQAVSTSSLSIAAAAGGLDTEVQFNDGGSALGGDAGLTYNKTTDTLTVGTLGIDLLSITAANALTLYSGGTDDPFFSLNDDTLTFGFDTSLGSILRLYGASIGAGVEITPRGLGLKIVDGATDFAAIATTSALTADRTFTFPNLSGTLVVTGASQDVSFDELTLGTDLSVANGGTGASTLTGILKGNGTSAFTAGVDGTDYTLTDAITCTNQAITAVTAAGVSTCASINNAFWSGTDLSVANGGTGLSTFGGTNHILYTTAADALSSEAAFTYTASTDNLTVVNASTTRLTSSGYTNLASAGSVVGVASTTPWATLAVNPIAGQASNQFVVGSSTATNFIVANTGRSGTGTTSPFASFSINSIAGVTPFAIGSSTRTSFMLDVLGRVLFGTTTGPTAGYSAIASSSFSTYENRLATSSTTDIPWGASNMTTVRMGSAAMTLTFSQLWPGAVQTIKICNPNQSVGGALTWPNGGTILWDGATAPTQITTADKCWYVSCRASVGTSTVLKADCLKAGGAVGF